jgi:hypothetical protein
MPFWSEAREKPARGVPGRAAAFCADAGTTNLPAPPTLRRTVADP